MSREREFQFTRGDFEWIREKVTGETGIQLNPSKDQMVYSRLARRLRALGLPDFASYRKLLEQDNGEEMGQFVNALTTNLTAFFREAHHFPLLAEHVRTRSGKVRIWCAAASTGEEPYSIAMTLMEAMGSRASQAEVVATDIDTDALARARAGIYPLEQVCKLEETRIKRFFQRGKGAHKGFARIRPDVAALLDFQALNLLAAQWPVTGPFDAIFCRNTMIYFDKTTQARILERFAPLLKPDGLLFAGHSESFSYITDAFQLRGQTVYTRRLAR